MYVRAYVLIWTLRSWEQYCSFRKFILNLNLRFLRCLYSNNTPLEIKVDGIRYMCNAHCLMTCTAPRGKPYEKKKTRMRAVRVKWSGRENAYGPARKAYYLMRARSVRKIQKHNGHLIKMVIEWVRSYILTSSQIFSHPALCLSQ